MFEFTIDGKAVKAEATFYTAQLYEAEFMSDIIADLFGVQRGGDTGEYEFEAYEDVNDDGESETRYRLTGIDFTKVSWNAVIKALWAAAKTADESTPSFARWSKNAKGIDLMDVKSKLSDELSECFFRAEAAGEEEPQE